MAETSTIATSLLSQLTSIRHEESYTGAEIAAHWVRFIVVVAAAALTTKAPMLWSAARILRKLKARHPYHLRQSAVSVQRDHVFIELYLNLSKGRHRKSSRLYPFLYLLFAFSIDVIDVSEFFFGRTFNPNIFSSEALTSLRLLIYVGSFATFGAVNLTLVQYAVLMLSTATLAILHITAGYGVLELSLEVRIALGITQLVLIVLFFLINMFFYSTCRTSLPDIASVMASTREENFGSHHLETVNLRKNLTESQRNELERMEHLAIEYRDFDEMSRRVVPVHWHEVSGICFFFVISSMGALMWGSTPGLGVPRVVFMDCLEGISVFLLFVNQTTVENVLFVKLLQIVNISTNKTQEISSDTTDDDGA